VQEANRKPRQTDKNGRPKEEIEKAEPDGRDGIEKVNGKVGEAKGKQRRSDKTEGENEHRHAQIGDRRGRETGAKGNPGGKDQPMAKKENDLDEEDGKDWPGFQTGSP
jgi:hypothetical protein